MVLIDGIIGWPRTPIGAGAEFIQSTCFPISAIAWEVNGLDPVTLFQTDDSHTRLGQAPGDSAAGGAGADDHHINLIEHASLRSLVRRSVACIARCGDTHMRRWPALHRSKCVIASSRE